MASLNTSQNGPSINSSYKKVVDSPPPSGSATHGIWAVYTVAAPLVSAFQQEGGKESVLKVQSTGEGELIDLVEEFSDGRIQFAFVKVKDPNTTLPKNILISWCGEGVPERTKGYFNSHRTVVSKLLQGYHVEITARSDSDLTPEGIVQKVADASGSKYSGGGSVPSSGGPPPPVASKPVFTPSRTVGGATGFNPLSGRNRASVDRGTTDDDGWGADAPQITRTQLEKVEPAYKPTKVNMAQLQGQQEPQIIRPAPDAASDRPDIVRGAYQPVGKVDINEIRRRAKESGSGQDDRPTLVKGAYEPVGKVDIQEIRRRAQRPDNDEPAPAEISPAPTGEEDSERPASLAARSAAFNGGSGGRILTEMPKPKVSNKFGGGAYSGTRAPQPGGYDPISIQKSAPVGTASKTYADQGGKTPAQIWAEKKARQSSGGVISPSATGGSPASPVSAQKTGGWESGYAGKKWAPVSTTQTGASAVSNLSDQKTGEENELPSGNVSSIKDRFAGGGPPPPVDMSSRPKVGGVAMPGFSTRPSANDIPAEQHVDVPTPPMQPRSPSPADDEDYARPESPIRVAMPVGRTKEPEPLSPPDEPEHAIPTGSLAKVASAHRGAADDGPARGAAKAAASSTFGAGAAAANPQGAVSGQRAIVQYDYEKAEDNEIELVEGQVVSNIEMVDEDWWLGENEKGERGLFPSNYVEIVEEKQAAPAAKAAAPAAPAAAPAAAAAGSGKTATAQYDYEAAEDNELSFPDGAKIMNVEFPDEDWWFGEYGGKSGLFPANYVEMND